MDFQEILWRRCKPQQARLTIRSPGWRFGSFCEMRLLTTRAQRLKPIHNASWPHRVAALGRNHEVCGWAEVVPTAQCDIQIGMNWNASATAVLGRLIV
jgi:hypothetical protein